MGNQSEERKESCIVRTTYGIMRFLGLTTRSLCEGFYFIAPFMRPQKTETEAIEVNAECAQRDLILTHSVREVTQPVEEAAHPVDEVIQKAEITKKPLEVTVDTDVLFEGIEFENKSERVKAEVSVKDFQSGLKDARANALEQLKKISKPAAIEILKKLLLCNEDHLRIIKILDTLSSLNDEGKLEKRIFADFLKRPDPALRRTAIRALAKYRDEESFSILSSCLEDKDAEVRRQTLNCLSWFFGVRCAPAVLKSLHDVNHRVRKTAILICGILKLRQSISALITLLSNPDKDIQKSAAASLRKITGQNFGFKVSSSEENKNAIIEDWRLWWRDNQTKFKKVTK